MSGEFYLNDSKHFIIQIVNDGVRIFDANNEGLPTSNEITLIKYSSLKNNENSGYIGNELDNPDTNLFNNFDKVKPILVICLQENLIITKEYQIYRFVKSESGFKIYDVKVIYNNNKKEIDYDYYLNQLEMGKNVEIDGYNIDKQSFDLCISDENNINLLNDRKLRNIYLNLVKKYKENTSEEIQGGSSNAKVKIRTSGFVNKIFMISLAGFAIGIVATLIMIIAIKYLFYK